MEPISILAGTLGAKVLEEGVKFLWSEAGKILDRYHKRREGSTAEEITYPAPPALQLPAARRIAFDVVERRSSELERLFGELAVYGAGARPIEAGDAVLLSRADELQSIVAEVFGVPPPSKIDSSIRVGKLEAGGHVTGVDAEGPVGNDIRSRIDVATSAGDITGIKSR